MLGKKEEIKNIQGSPKKCVNRKYRDRACLGELDSLHCAKSMVKKGREVSKEVTSLIIPTSLRRASSFVQFLKCLTMEPRRRIFLIT